ncbi:MAG: carboxypeptidase M32 [Chloroflexi bacterium]|nr:carboxypeptidase M32 [Chloroflexota bacterium]
MAEKYQQLLARLADVQNLNKTAAVLGWDQQTQMPPGSAEPRAHQLELLARLSHEMFVSEETARLLQDAAAEVAGAPYDSVEASMIRVVQQDYDDQVKLPTSLVSEIARVTTLAHEVWAKARANNDFLSFRDTLEKIFDLAQQAAQHLGYKEHPYDALINQFERGITTAQVKQIFDEHKPALVELVHAIGKHDSAVSDALLHQDFDVEQQRKFSVEVATAIGFDFQHGRLDTAVHPFCTNFGREDVRLTTRFDPKYIGSALFGTMHEAGHGMYEQGSGAELEYTPLSGGTSLAVHESQSRMWENMVGRSKGFWQWALPKAQQYFPQLARVDVDTFYKAINKVKRSFIRVEADEATYNLHIMLRFEIETGLLEGKIKVADLPEEWNARFESYLGVVPPNDTLGVLQDVHWSSGLIGYFATYALGNMLAAQYYNRALQAHPGIPDEIASGKFDTLLGWLRSNIHEHGRKYTSDELTRRITGESIQSRDYIQYLQTKYSALYGL